MKFSAPGTALLGFALASCAGAPASTATAQPGASPPIVQVANEASNTVASYELGVSGNVAPTRMLGGSQTGLNRPTQVWPIVGSVLYVVNRGNDSITGYPNSNGGNVAPTIVIAGAKTTLNAPASLQLDASNAIWVANFGNDTVLKFAAGANGNVAPILRLAGAKTGLHGPNSLHYAFRTGEVYVLNRNSNSVAVFAKGSLGNVAPAQLIVGPMTGLREPGQLELDSKGNIWIANTGAGNVLEFSLGATGDVAPINTLTLAAGAFRPSGLAFDAADNLTVGDASQNTLYEFSASGIKGKATPIAIVRGSKTGLRSPQRLGVPQTVATPIPGT